jgi:uncharacterized protein YrrD
VPDPVSWKVVERGWDVIGADGEKLGHVDDILGDDELDIFDGISVSGGLLKGRRYVAADQVGPIYDGEIHVLVAKDVFEHLPPPS